MRFILMPQASKFAAINRVFDLVYRGLSSSGEIPEVIGIRGKGYFPDIPVKMIDEAELHSLFLDDKVNICADEYKLMDLLSRTPDINPRNLIIWVHYFIGHSFLFRQYSNEEGKLNKRTQISYSLRRLVPRILLDYSVRNYVNVLRKSTVIAQSLWTALLINRVYDLVCEEVVFPPVEPGLFKEHKSSHKKNQVLIFLGNERDTSISAAAEIVDMIKQTNPDISYHTFGSYRLSNTFASLVKTTMNYQKEVSNADLVRLYSESVLTISPVYNGTFELVPIESLLSGTPVISYYQPFLEITGFTEAIANIYNPSKVSELIRDAIEEKFSDKLTTICDTIISEMNYIHIADKLLSVEKPLRK